MAKQPTDLPGNQVKTNPNLEKRTRRTFTREYKLSMIQRAEACGHGELGELLRQERLYGAHIREWREIFEKDGFDGFSKTQPGQRGKKTAEQRKVEQLSKEAARLTKELSISHGCIELKKKVLGMHEQIQNDESGSR
jgi:transposase-like protein